MAKIGLVVMALVAGIALGFSFRKESVSPDQGKYQELRNKLENLSQVDVQEYLALKEQKAKYEKADEILGKILMIMLYDFGIRASEPQLAALKGQALTATKDSPQTPTPAPPAAIKPTETKPSENRPATGVTWKNETAAVAEISSEQEIKDFLKKIEISDFNRELQSGAPLTQAQIELLDGTFDGEATFDDPKNHPWQVELRFNGRLVDGKFSGEQFIRLRRDGRQFSRTRGKISPDDYLSVNGEPNGMMVNANDGDGYFLLYYFPRANQFYGLVFTKVAFGKFRQDGVVRLIKR